MYYKPKSYLSLSMKWWAYIYYTWLHWLSLQLYKVIKFHLHWDMLGLIF